MYSMAASVDEDLSWVEAPGLFGTLLKDELLGLNHWRLSALKGSDDRQRRATPILDGKTLEIYQVLAVARFESLSGTLRIG